MKRLHPAPPYFAIGKAPLPVMSQWNTYPSIPQIFKIITNGIATHNNSFCYTDNPQTILSRIYDIQTLSTEDLIIKYSIRMPRPRGCRWHLDKILHEFRIDKRTHNHIQYITPVMVSPLDTLFTYYTADTFFIAIKNYSNLSPLLTVPDNHGLLFNKTTYAHHIATSPFVSSLIPNASGCLSTGNPAYIAPLYIDNTILATRSKISNIRGSFLNTLQTTYNHTPAPEDILGYVYSILWHIQYRTHYCQALRLDFPRIPLVKSLTLFRRLASLGKQLITLHKNPPRSPLDPLTLHPKYNTI